MPLSILVVEDEPDIRASLGEVLRRAGHHIVEAADGVAALERLCAQPFDLLMTDIRMPRMDGLTLFRHAQRERPEAAVILMTGYGAIPQAVSALKEGAHDYLIKPVNMDEICIRVQRLDEERRLRQEFRLLRDRRALTPEDEHLLGRSPVMARLQQRLVTIARSDAPVLITGESGTGKELAARRILALSARRAQPFIAVNCAAFPETLIEAELFGHERGAFTGALKRRLGRFQAAHGGTLLLDEVAEVPLPIQAKLLRVLQEGVVEPLGSDVGVSIDVRIISATHRNLRRLIAEGRFREDLYYRLNVLDIALPPLRERRGDLPVLLDHFLRRRLPPGARPPGISARVWAALAEYPFPGNVRELEHAVEHALVLAQGGEILLEHLPADIVGVTRDLGEGERPAALRPLGEALRDFEREYLLRALARADGKKARAAELLGISRKNLWEKLRSHDLLAGDSGEG